MLRPEIFTWAKDWPNLASAHPKVGWGPPKKLWLWKFKIWPKIQRFKVNNFRVSGSILTGLLSVDGPRGRADNLDTIFTRPAPKNLWPPKNRPKFLAIFDNFWLWSRISPERINRSKIGISLENLQPLPRWTKKSWCTLVHKRKSYWAE